MIHMSAGVVLIVNNDLATRIESGLVYSHLSESIVSPIHHRSAFFTILEVSNFGSNTMRTFRHR